MGSYCDRRGGRCGRHAEPSSRILARSALEPSPRQDPCRQFRLDSTRQPVLITIRAIFASSHSLSSRGRHGANHWIHWAWNHGPPHGQEPAQGRLPARRPQPEPGARSRSWSARAPRRRAPPEDVAAQVDVLITMLPNSPDVELVALGKDGIIEGASRGLLFSTCRRSRRSSRRRSARRSAAKGVRMLDAPVSGRREGRHRRRAVDHGRRREGRLRRRAAGVPGAWARPSRTSARSAPAASPSSPTRSSSP